MRSWWRREHGLAPEPAPAPADHYAELGTLPPEREPPSEDLVAHRPLPGANAWPDDAVLLTYAEIRRLIAFHLDLTWQSMPKDHPWLWIRRRAGAMRDGESPLLLSEVMDLPPTDPPATLS